MKKQEEEILSRRFLGKLDNFTDKKERALEQKHLKAYLKGQTHFHYGRKYLEEDGVRTGFWVPLKHEVKQEYFMVKNLRYKK